MASKFSITLEFEPIVKLYCTNHDCRFNLSHNQVASSANCNLKYVEIGNDGKCKMLEESKKPDA